MTENLLKLHSLLDLFPGDGLQASTMEVVEPAAVPEPYHSLLVHNHHMTVTLEKHHGCRLHLEVLKTRHVGEDYSRQLVLTSGAGGKVVLSGIMRIHLQFCGAAVADEIVQGETPLGRVLIEHDVMRSIESHAYLRVGMSPELREIFGKGEEREVTYGRIARIICDHEPAVELLEIVAPE